MKNAVLDIISDKIDTLGYLYRSYIRLPIMEIVWFIQRGRRGWADCDTWNMNDYLAKVIPEMIDYDIKNGTGSPFGFETMEDWHNVLNEMASGFKAYNLYNEDCYWYDATKSREWNQRNHAKFHKETQKALDKSTKLLGKYFFNLWD